MELAHTEEKPNGNAGMRDTLFAGSDGEAQRDRKKENERKGSET